MSATRMTRTIATTLVTITAVIITGLVALMLVPGLLGMDRYVITGGSMSGTFERGTLVLERQVPVSDLRVGDVITYLPPEDSGVTELVTHRIVETTEQSDAAGGRVFRTKGDANESADPWTFTLAAAQQPRVEGWIPAVGWVFIALSAPGIRMLAIGVPAALIALLYLRDLLRGLRLWPGRAAPVAQL
ncbi:MULTISPECIES: signal peptidase I [unclassified Microbacterium]|uniref:signal peptidase I n=1 Tax=unclassified Microbacterium TaxID=2609290 RepID=UPI0012FA2324|nr:signal peptidase I [Microbacterium sp. MAH-37]MVQ43864.1 signal peptidase I [Microbacterium sp. MAH-37]